MKKYLSTVSLFFMVTFVYAQTIDSAIEDAANEISGRLKEKSTVAVISFQSASTRLTDYVIDELNGKIANIGKIKPVERRQLNAIRSELNFNMSGDVSDESAQRIGQMVGSQYIVMGSIELIGNLYRIRFQAITVESASIEYSFSQNVKSDITLQALLKGTDTLVDFTSTERWSASGLNLLFGLGSFIIENDTSGGVRVAIFEGLGVGLMIAGQLLYNADNPHKRYDDTILETYYAYPFYIGLGTYLVGAVYGIIRAQTYHKPGSSVVVSPFERIQLNLVSLDNKKIGLQATYKLRF